MTNRIVFTIVAKNYSGLAAILGDSVLQNSTNTTFIVFIADEIDADFKVPHGEAIYIPAKTSLGINAETWDEMAFKYNLTEFCTAIKPYCFSYLMKAKDASQFMYVDPDILFFSNLQPIWDYLLTKDIIITPHIVTPEILYTGAIPETNILTTGIYNLGFIAVNKTETTLAFIAWWQNRLTDNCFADKAEGLFTDQKWVDFLPALFDSSKIEISKNLGMNVAPWNFYERQFVIENNEWFVTNRITGRDKYKLIFVHFSGFNYQDIEANLSANKNILHLKLYDDVKPVMHLYSSIIKKSNIKAYFNYKYTYNYFANGKPILHFHRRLYRRLLLDKYIKGNPFIAEDKTAFYNLLEKAHLLPAKGAEDTDKLNERNFENFEKKLYLLNILHKTAKRLIGTKNYLLFSKFMLRYHRPENQPFLIDKKFMKISFKNEHY